MNHLSKKKKLYGAGKQPTVKPAVLSPPKIGDFQFGASFSYIETLDLISDGPIEGLVDPKGNLLHESALSRGIYLDGTAVSIAPEEELNEETETSSDQFVGKSVAITTFSNLNTKNKGGASVSESLKYADAFRSSGLRTKVTFSNLVEGYDPYFQFKPEKTNWGQKVFDDIDKEYLTEDVRFIQNSKSFRIKEDHKNIRYQYSMLFANNSTIDNSDFFVSFVRDNHSSFNLKRYTPSSFRYVADYFFAEKFDDASDIDLGEDITYKRGKSGASFFQKILGAWSRYKAAGNTFMTDMIEAKMDKVFGSYDWKHEKTAQQLYDRFFSNNWRAGYMAIYYPERDILSSVGAVKFSNAKEVSLVPTEGGTKDANIYKSSSYIDLLFPVCDNNGNLQTSTDIFGAAFIFIKKNYSEFTPKSEASKTVSLDILSILKDLKRVTHLNITQKTNSFDDRSKYNYNNVLIEARNGYEQQEPFRFFNKVHIDKVVDKSVYGPFKSTGQVQRIKRNTNDKKDSLAMDGVGYDGPEGSITLQNGLPTNEGSNDNARTEFEQDYSSWNSTNKQYLLEEKASPITYTIHNPNVSEVFVTLRIDSLFDTVEKQYGTEASDFKAGDKLPAIMNVEIEVGKILSDGALQPTLTKTYRVAALIESPTLIDIGNPSNTDSPEQFRHIRDFDNLDGNANLSTPFPLPRIRGYSSNNVYEAPEKRYVRVSKLSTETFSVLISKSLSFYKVTEIIPVNLTYPFSAIVGTKIDSKSFSSTPQRSFDARLKLVQIPNNYFPTEEYGFKKDKRYYDKKSEFDTASEESKEIYRGDWDGEFKEGWTDNPAWILYDLLTNKRYGLGRYVEPEDINKWELYKVGRFCDAVDSNGIFEGVPDGRGGLEPRYSCNIMFKSDEKVFDSIQLISKLFRGQTFFRASEVSFTDERVKSPIATFNNNNVKDGAFNYSNLRRDQQFNTVEVSYLDRFENFTPKVEVVEDEEDIRSRGIFKKRVDGMGVTSRAMARRIGQHLIHRTIKENQRVAFTSGLEALLCQPGDLIIVDDDLKNEKSNFGKILSVDVDNEYIQLSGPWDSSTMTGVLTVYNPTGVSSISDLDDVANVKRVRTDTFTITGVPTDTNFNAYTGLYNFSGYRDGYTDSNIEELTTFSEYALYTGAGGNMLYFGTGYTGWTFATSLEEADRDYIAQSTGIQTLFQLNTGVIVNYNSSASDKRGSTTENISGFFSGDLNELGARGILESEIVLNAEQPQIIELTVTGDTGNGNGFSYVSGFDNPDYLQFIKLGSPYRFDLKSVDNTLYKIDSIREQSPNEYLVSAAKFQTGKFKLIEDNISIEQTENTYDYNVETTIGDTTYTTLSAPQNLSLTTGAGTESTTFYISGSWDEVTDASSYEAILRYPSTSTVTTGIAGTGVKFDNLVAVGNYALSVKAVGDSSTSNKTIDSEYSTVKSFFLYEELEIRDNPIITSINIR